VFRNWKKRWKWSIDSGGSTLKETSLFNL
jgi:hypothetical protein